MHYHVFGFVMPVPALHMSDGKTSGSAALMAPVDRVRNINDRNPRAGFGRYARRTSGRSNLGSVSVVMATS